MAEEKPAEQPAASNTISEQTGQFDARFLLWRAFCTDYNIPVETLPSELTGDAKEKWEDMKENRLHKPAEEE